MSTRIPDTGVAPNDKDVLSAMGIDQDDNVQAGNIFKDDHNPAPEFLSALGNCDEILGSFTLKNSFGRLMLLSHIDSPYMDDSNEPREVTLMDQARCIYILAHGEDALRPVYTVERKLARLKDLEEMANKSPENFQLYLDKYEQISEHESDFDIKAMAYYDENMSVSTFENVNQIIGELIEDGLSGFEAIADNTDDIAKKKNPE